MYACWPLVISFYVLLINWTGHEQDSLCGLIFNLCMLVYEILWQSFEIDMSQCIVMSSTKLLCIYTMYYGSLVLLTGLTSLTCPILIQAQAGWECQQSNIMEVKGLIPSATLLDPYHSSLRANARPRDQPHTHAHQRKKCVHRQVTVLHGILCEPLSIHLHRVQIFPLSPDQAV